MNGHPPEQHDSPPRTISPRQPRDFGELARRLRGRSLDLLAIGLAGAIIVGIGRQAVEWWAVDPAGSSGPEQIGTSIPLLPLFGAGGQPVTLEFGRRQARLTRRVFQGSRESAVEQLAVLCLERTLAAPVPRHPPDRAEQSLLETLAGRSPWDAQPKRWQVYVTEGPVSLAVGLRWAGEADEPPSADKGSSTVFRWRVAACAYAFPADRQQHWTIYETEPLAGDGRVSASPALAGSLRNQLLPDSITPLVSLTAADGSSVTSFRVEPSASGGREGLRTRCERAARRAGGILLQDWTADGDTDRAVWSVTSTEGRYRWEVQLRADGSGSGIAGWASLLKEGSGMETAAPASEPLPANEP